jgi:LuxR family transcriptional activator of conjugal transfer of Ti plasmids
MVTVKLSEREKTCLSWAALGKSSWDIATILGLSEHTVNFHLENAMKKLDAPSRTVACFRAVKLGLIENPSEAP